MAYEIAMMQRPIFECYVNPAKNDIAKWVEEVFSKKDLADKLRKTTDKTLTSKIIHNYLNNTSTTIEKPKKVIDEEEPLIENEDSLNEDARTDEADEADNSTIKKDEPLPVEEHKIKKLKISGKENTSSQDKIEKVAPTLDSESKKPGKIKHFFKKIFSKNKNSKIMIDSALSETEKQEEPKKETDPDDDEVEYVPEFIKTGVPGFDDLITNGIPKGSSVLLCGGAGSGKTTFSLQILAYWAEHKKKCLYLTFEEDVSRLKSHMRDFGWDPKKLIEEGNLKIKRMDPFEISRSVEALLAKASGELIIDINEVDGIVPDGFRPDIIVLDSLSAVSAAFIGKEEGYRIYVEQLFNMFKRINATSFLISEVEENTNKYTRAGIEEFLADAVIVFYSLRQKSVRVTALEIIKVRGTQHQKKIAPFKMITGKGMIVFPKEDPFIE